MSVIARLDVFAARAPISQPVATSFGVMHDRPAVFLRVEDADGAFGWGEIFANWPAAGAEHRANLMADDLAPIVLGSAADDPAALWADLTARTHVRRLQCGEFGPFDQCLAGLDQALWDLRARREDVSLRKCLNPDAADTVPVYASGIHVDGAEAVIAAARDDGYGAFKVKVGGDPLRDADRVVQIASGLATGERLMADANQAWNVDQTLAFLDGIAGLDLAWLEEPIAVDRPAAEWRAIAGTVPLAGGENISGTAGFAAADYLGVVQPDIAKWGGLSGCLTVARTTIAEGHTYCPHFLGGGIGLSHSAQLLAAAGGPGRLEVDVNPNPLRSLLCPTAAHLVGGRWRCGDTTPPEGTLPDDVAAFVTHHRRAAFRDAW